MKKSDEWRNIDKIRFKKIFLYHLSSHIKGNLNGRYILLTGMVY